MQKDATFTFRLPRALREALEKEARRDMRSLSQLLVKILAERYGAGRDAPKRRRP